MKRAAALAVATVAVLAAAPAPSEAAKKPPAPIETVDAASGSFLLRNGRFRPLDDVASAAVTAHVATNNRGQTAGFYPRCRRCGARLPP